MSDADPRSDSRPDAKPAGKPGAAPRQPRRKLAATIRRFALDNIGPVLIAVTGMVAVHKGIIPALPDAGFLGTVKAKLTVHPYIPPACTMLLFWHLSYVIMRLLVRVQPEFAVLAQNPIPAGVDQLTDDEVTAIARRAMEIETRFGATLLTRRIFLAVQHLGISRDTAELGDLLRRRADADRQRASTAYLWPQFLVWAIPILGFVGTVLGIGHAVGGLSGTIENEAGFTGALRAVTKDLGVAFDTTLVALIMSIIALLVQTLISQRESRLLADVEDYLTYRLQSRVRSDTLDVRVAGVLQSSLAELTQLQERINTDEKERAQLSMQTIMRAQQSLQETLSKMPAVIDDAATKSTAMLQEVRNSLQTVGAQATTSMQQAILGAMDAGREDLANLRAGMFEGTAKQVEHLLSQNSTRYREAVAPIEQALERVAGQLDKVIGDGQRLLTLQDAMNENLTTVSRTQNLDEALNAMRSSIEALRPVLEKLSRPVPLRLTLGGVEVEPGHENPTQRIPQAPARPPLGPLPSRPPPTETKTPPGGERRFGESGFRFQPPPGED
jgi:biopolymer transport protein ExbB/TolQ